MHLSQTEQIAKQWNQRISFDYRDQIEKDDFQNNENLTREMTLGCSKKLIDCK